MGGMCGIVVHDAGCKHIKTILSRCVKVVNTASKINHYIHIRFLVLSPALRGCRLALVGCPPNIRGLHTAQPDQRSHEHTAMPNLVAAQEKIEPSSRGQGFGVPFHHDKHSTHVECPSPSTKKMMRRTLVARLVLQCNGSIQRRRWSRL